MIIKEHVGYESDIVYWAGLCSPSVSLTSCVSRPQASEMTLEYPGWALAMIVMLILFASLPVPIGYILSMLKSRSGGSGSSEEGGSPEVHRELYTKCSSTEQLGSNSHHRAPSEEDEARLRPVFLPLGHELYTLLPQQEDEDEEQDTGV